MKSHIRMLSIAILFMTIVISCKKEKENPPVKTPEELLTTHTWKANELRTVSGNTPLYYKRGSSVSPEYNLDNESILFRTDHTGLYKGATGGQFPFTWSFSNTEKTKLTWNVQFSGPTVVNWYITSLTEQKLEYNEYFTTGGVSSQTFGDRIPE